MKIRFATDILRRLGEELNPSVDKGILELVKNAYDADAIHCTIELVNIDQIGGTIVVRDDGDSMTADDIENGWLVLGRSTKDQKKKTRLNRIPVGSKGLGRLASLRMGTQALLTTRPRSEKNSEYNLLIDWREFEGVDLVEEVSLTLEEGKRGSKVKSGTEVRIEGLHVKIGRRDVKRLARELILLAGPFGDDPTGFKPELKAPEFRDLESLVKNRYFKDADYHLVASMDNRGRANAKVLDWRGAALFEGTHEEISSKSDHPAYECPPINFEFWTFILEQRHFTTRSVALKDVRAWLQEFGGVHIYQNGLRVTPYGDPGNDWLQLNLSRVRSPEERPSTNNSIGKVVFSDTESLLIQKTDRSGFIETDTFREIHDFAKDALDWMAKRRLEEAQKRREREKEEARSTFDNSRRQLKAAVEKLPKASRESVSKAIEYAWMAVDKQINQFEQEIQLYRTLSTAGITSATFAHESAANPIKVIRSSIDTIERRARKQLPKFFKKELKEPVEGIVRATDSLAVVSNVTLGLLDHEKRRPARVDMHKVIDNVLGTFEPFLSARDVRVDKKYCDGSPFLRGSEAAIESIITNLLNNSVAAFERSEKKDRCVLIATSVSDSLLTLRVADSGPGIEGISKREIWLPGRTTRKNGTGLGLTIVKDTVKDLGGDVDAVKHGELGGAEILIQLPILGV